MGKMTKKPSPPKIHDYSKENLIDYIESKYTFSQTEIDSILVQFKLEGGMTTTSQQMHNRVEALLIAWLRHSQTGYEEALIGNETFSDYYFKKQIFTSGARKILDRYRKK